MSARQATTLSDYQYSINSELCWNMRTELILQIQNNYFNTVDIYRYKSVFIKEK